MAGSVRPGAEGLNHESATGLDVGGVSASGLVSGRARTEKRSLVGSIVLGLAIGAAAGILLGGLMGIHESGSSDLRVSGTSVVEPSAP